MYYFVNGGAPNNPGFNALPDYVQRKIIANMMYGGMRYQDGGESEEIIRPEDMETYNTVSQTSPGQDYSYSRFVGPQYQSMAVPTSATPSFALNPYQGVSVWDFLTAQGKSGDFATRKKIASDLGISNYKGTPGQNKLMMEMLMQNPDTLLNVSSVGSPKKGAGRKKAVESSPEIPEEEMAQLREEYLNQQAAANPYLFAPTPNTDNGYIPYTMDEGVDFSGPATSSGYIIPAAAVTGAGLGVYGAARAMGPKVANDLQLSVDLMKTNIPAKDIIAYAKKFGKDSETFNILRAKGMSPKDINIALKGVKFNPNATQQITMSLGQMTDITGKSVKDAGKMINQMNVDKAKKLVEVMKLRGGVRDPQLVNQVYKLVANPAEANALMKGLKFGPSVGSAAAAGSGLLRGNLGKIGKFLFRREDGGELSKYQEAGVVLPQPIERTEMFDPNYEDSLGEDVLEFFDFSGASSWDDIAEMRRRQAVDPNAYSGFLGGLDKALTYASAIPVFGEVGKIGKGLKGLGKYIVGAEKAAEKLAKIKKATAAKKSLPGKTVAAISRSIIPAADIATAGPLLRMAERANPVAYGTSRMWEKGLSSLPGSAQKVVRPVSRTAGNFGRLGKSSDLYARGYDAAFGSGQGPVMFKTPSGQIIELLPEDPRFGLIEGHVIGADPETGVYYVDSDSPYSSAVETAAPVAPAPRQTKSAFKSAFNKKNGGSYSGTYSAGVYYQGGGSFDSSNYAPGSPLPKFNYGSMMAYGGSSSKKKKNMGEEMYVTPEEMEMLRQQGYDFDVIG
jgi:hypothetical protein